MSTYFEQSQLDLRKYDSKKIFKFVLSPTWNYNEQHLHLQLQGTLLAA